MVHLVHPNGSVSCLQDQLVCHIDQFFTCLQDQSVCYRKHNTPHVPTRGSVSYLFSGSISLSWKRHSTPHAPWSVSFLPVFRINQSVMEETQYTSCTMISQFLTCLQDQSVCHGRDTVHLMHHDQSVSYLSSGSISLLWKRHSTPHAPWSVSFLPVFRINQSVMEETQYTSCTMISQFLTCLHDQSVCRRGHSTWYTLRTHRRISFFTCLQDQSVCRRRHGTPRAPKGGSASQSLSCWSWAQEAPHEWRGRSHAGWRRSVTWKVWGGTWWLSPCTHPWWPPPSAVERKANT